MSEASLSTEPRRGFRTRPLTVAEARYGRLCARHPHAFTDHLAGFRLAIGDQAH
ncbi:hypothetical protein [Streptomyces sp. NPDC040750]|uniref:hypothetical protein n=1 Tax=Streptomyces sp. NPDC040750 TaxID=3154491 RepID=UPI0033D0FF27